ncbi:hypothetical protein BpHYR1_000603 [Brachionus plicatilis]|uniref:Uncharacterized protein n=1 Tax=Brachionus plicatilis TaxID=10195 RepID=A0A3M7R655_BRAPC|nr:hypothetical protein BpHYR1_000603 [Brachionus plicatilis]
MLDYMHLCIIGTYKKIFNNFFDSKNWNKPYYLKKVINFIDNRMSNFSLPNSFSRKLRSLNERAHYKANEFRTLAFYLSFGLFDGLLDDQYL